MLFDKFQSMASFQADLAERDIAPFGAVTEQILSATEGTVQGKKVILAGTNNYLGMSCDPRCIRAAQQAAEQWGTGTTGSRLANGSFTEHQALETEIADFYGVDHAIVFSTGYSATMGMCATLAGPGETILLDGDSHASIYSGVKQSGAEIIRFKHNNPEDLAKRMRRLGDRAGNALIIAEGIYSMLGDVAPLKEIAAVKREYGGYLLVDEAHSMGVLGQTGRGAAQAAGVEDDVDFSVGTFSKSLGSIGGFCVSRHPELEAIRYCISAYIFTASSSPSVVASTREALRIITAQPELREKLWDNARHLYAGLKALGLGVGPSASPVVAVEMEDRPATIQGWQALLDAGVYVNLVVPPASPSTNFLLRNSVSAAHSSAQIDTIIAAYAGLIENGVITSDKTA
ncbi:serine palmitoyltransferase [Candidatus Marimicrobium litorale]|jgi:8-amino-7-oxononanoate synthase|uniref:Aminotransferase class I/II-fold pyridoxal phosphate-dependent enzyme n=1 Tax=Candidatus Marimicrobium litorale TaxID=2518991 RepID=A0ABT3T6R5_9GAMM|nr:aminotransferase class I/II-fold pyridoxal phosphate-dependent enzyme [Candidatus Marimicrobium litorale]MCX2977965.1 aminotransferase class I/II-fold pyridoxal phosphate-dependent enzyme [Candidatus Marimicrobium litorale]